MAVPSNQPLPFTYLGLPVGAQMSSLKHWKPVVDKFHSVLSSWKASSLYFLSLFRLPAGLLNPKEADFPIYVILTDSATLAPPKT
uniref:Uncharacterized protein n=1 Tax=Utricularia reniformis TaxID=192314 RepID=A0A1Y0AZX0_9LAMI|nr:hypothetical protein AEK19_MT0413 [Utricularia reniformis]ART30679.1 hypothetical protein AEK19_MT0413 [Utricularia reniformis]